jgi:hypothetical protein
MWIFASAFLAVCPLCALITQKHSYGNRGPAVADATRCYRQRNTTAVRAITNSTGYYEAPLLVPGNCQMSVQANGFKNLLSLWAWTSRERST